MDLQLTTQIILWIFGAIASAVALSQYHAFRQKERRLPAACELETVEVRLTGRKNELADAQVKLTKAHELIGEAAQKQAELIEIRSWFHENREQLKTVEGERKQQEALRAQITILRDERAAAEAEIRRVQTSFNAELVKLREEKTTSLAELERIQKERGSEAAALAYMGTQKASLEAELAQWRHGLDTLKQEIQDRTITRNVLQSEQALKEKELNHLQDQVEEARIVQEKAKQKLDDLVAKISAEGRRLVETETKHHILNQACERLKAEIADLEKWKETLLGLLSRLQAEVDRLDPQSAAEDRYRDLWEPITFPTLSLGRASLPEAEALQETENYLKSHSLIYPKRVLYAFHSALKTADMSPLTVLAGISGTGKSLLPKRYSEAMGIHMVSLAVQPRWDSPQDLFGFFNHLERRFKSTDLARAMVQFELFNRKDWALPKDWKEGRENRMLLVLLDEMNLARVEYYFSEFLSRLETRRDVNEGNPFDRARAEILLDMGSLRKDERPIRLYPGKNILFTGTMNEDESTQTLSDKVVDRACVLRFGRPKQLERLRTMPARDPREEGLGLKNWMQWCKPSLSDTEHKTLESWIQKLNEGMDSLGKPFAHRVHQAILGYAARYPRLNGNDPLRMAFADQIEQRILPKLRGVELDGNSESFSKLEKVIEHTQDKALIRAFKDGQDARSGTFLWRGLDRSEG
jgi:hypothetical protein